MPNVCSLSSALHFHCNSMSSCGSSSTCREWKRLFCILFTAGRSELMWLITYSLPLIYLHLRNGSWTANWNGTPIRHALRKNWDQGWGVEGDREGRGGEETSSTQREWERSCLLKEALTSPFQWVIPSAGYHFPLLALCVLCYIYPNIWQKVPRFKHPLFLHQVTLELRLDSQSWLSAL